MTDRPYCVWRTLLFVPATNDRFIARAHTRGADGIILDLEDAVLPENKCHAREALPDAIASLSAQGCDVLVRVNADSMVEDIAAACQSHVRAIILPKVLDGTSVTQASAHLDLLERERNVDRGSIKFIAQIEDVRALPHLDEIAGASPRLLGMSLGSEDFSTSCGMVPLPETLYWPNQQVVFACRRAGIAAFGFPASITLFTDQQALEQAAIQAANMGFEGAFCIHPDQVAILNRAFTPCEDTVVEARALLDVYDQAKSRGDGAVAFRGKMIDLPVVLRARALVNRAEAISARKNT
jgi:citrate lyase subunit beta / citryl-CoA lyase